MSTVNLEGRADARSGLAVAVILVGIAVRGWQYAANPSIWVDEAALARNVLDRTYLQLLGSLDYAQLAAPGFLLGVKLSTAILGSSEYALRLVPFGAGVLSPVLFFVVVRVLLRPVGAIVATFMFSIATPLVYFSSNFKPYSSDVFVALLVVGLSVHLLRSCVTLRRAIVFATASALLLFCSQAAVFSLTAAGVVVAADAFLRRRPDRWNRFLVVVSWAGGVLASVAHSTSTMSSVDRAYFHRFWAPAFMPRAGLSDWLWVALQGVFAGPPGRWTFDGSLHYSFPGLFVVLMVVGSLAMCLGEWTEGLLLAGPIFLVLTASALRLYPFGTRADLFLVPFLLILVVAGVESLSRLFIRESWGRLAPVLLLPIPVAAFLSQLPPRTPEHLRPVMRYLSERWQPGDALWVYYGAGQAFEYYAKRIPIRGDIRVGECDRTDPREYLRQVDRERGRARVWIVMSHGSGPFGFDERRLVVAYLESIGRRLDEFHAPVEDLTTNRSAAFLFDLSDPVRLASTNAEQFPIQTNSLPQTWSCYATMSPFGASQRVVSSVLQTESP